MPFVKNSLDLLIEAGRSDLNCDTASVVRESIIKKNYQTIATLREELVYPPAIVPVIQVDGGYYTEMNFLYPYMKSAGITTIAEALNDVAEANGLPSRAVGLLIESDDSVDECITKAIESANPKKKNNVLNKISKAVDISDRLKDAGINVKKKKSKKCPKCGKAKCVCK